MKRTALTAATIALTLSVAPLAYAQDATDTHQEQSLGAEDVDTNSEAPVANGTVKLPPVINIDGTTYYLNVDGQTYMSDINRVTEEPLYNEMKQSAFLISEHGAEISQQGLEAAQAAGEAPADKAPSGEVPAHEANAQQMATEPVNLDRGMSAQTGDNSVSKGLIGLVIASVLGAAAFFYGRRFLV